MLPQCRDASVLDLTKRTAKGGEADVGYENVEWQVRTGHVSMGDRASQLCKRHCLRIANARAHRSGRRS